MSSQKVTTITLKNIFAIAVGAFVTGIVGTIIAMAGIANTDHFTLIDHGKRISTVEAEKVNKAENDLDKKAVQKEFDVVNTKLDKIMDRLNIISLADFESAILSN